MGLPLAFLDRLQARLDRRALGLEPLGQRERLAEGIGGLVHGETGWVVAISNRSPSGSRK